LKKIADSMTNASGAEIKGVCTEAGMFALRERRVHVTQDDFEMAVAKIMHKDTKDAYFKKLIKRGEHSQLCCCECRAVKER